MLEAALEFLTVGIALSCCLEKALVVCTTPKAVQVAGLSAWQFCRMQLVCSVSVYNSFPQLWPTFSVVFTCLTKLACFSICLGLVNSSLVYILFLAELAADMS